MKKTNKTKANMRPGNLSTTPPRPWPAMDGPPLERLVTVRRKGEMAPPLCCVGSCLESATWRFAAAPPIKLPYCDRHLPARANAPAWTLRFAPAGQPNQSQVRSYDLLKVIEQGFADGAMEVTVRRAG